MRVINSSKESRLLTMEKEEFEELKESILEYTPYESWKEFLRERRKYRHEDEPKGM